VLDLWREAHGAGGAWTTIATWENKGKNIAFGGETYVWSKHVNFLRVLDVPKDSSASFELALLSPAPGVVGTVEGAGWRVIDPRPLSSAMPSYAQFIGASRGEFTVAKDIYVRPMSGWFSDRSVCYLASGRPVVTMKTGWSRFYPSGDGLIEYEDRAGALEALARVEADYSHHARAARAAATEHFGSRPVLEKLAAEMGL
jgi:hypothetical protein